MKEIICIGILIVLAGCVPVMSGGQSTGPAAEGWYNSEKTDQQHSQDLRECTARCASA